MIRKGLLLVSCGILVASATMAQTAVHFEFRSGYGGVQMNDLSKELQYNADVIRVQLPEARIVNDFPAWYNHGANVLLKFDDFEAGVSYTFQSSGARVHYADYSGEVGMEYRALLHNFGFYPQYVRELSKKFEFTLGVPLTLSVTPLSVRIWGMLGNDLEEVNEKFTSYSFTTGFMPGIRYSLNKTIYLGARVGAMLDVGARPRWNNDVKVRLIANDGKDMQTNWTGLRGEAFIGIRVDLDN